MTLHIYIRLPKITDFEYKTVKKRQLLTRKLQVRREKKYKYFTERHNYQTELQSSMIKYKIKHVQQFKVGTRSIHQKLGRLTNQYYEKLLNKKPPHRLSSSVKDKLFEQFFELFRIHFQFNLFGYSISNLEPIFCGK